MLSELQFKPKRVVFGKKVTMCVFQKLQNKNLLVLLVLRQLPLENKNKIISVYFSHFQTRVQTSLAFITPFFEGSGVLYAVFAGKICPIY